MLEKFKPAIKKEILYYLLTLVLLTLIIHIDMLSDPLTRLELMQEKGNYSHPFIYTLIVYGIVFILRKTIDFIVGIFEKKINKN